MYNPEARLAAQPLIQASVAGAPTGPTQVALPPLQPSTPEPPNGEMCFDVDTGTFVGGPYHGRQAPQGTWGLSEDGQTVTINIGGDVASELPVCPKQPPPPAEPDFPPECCVHILTDDLASIGPDSPAAGRTDCPGYPEYHEVDVIVLAVEPDGEGGMNASFHAPFDPALGTTTAPKVRVWPVCTVGKQEDPPVECCIIAGEDGQYVKCKDTTQPPHGMLAEEAIAHGYTLEVCPPPPDIPPCCVELGEFGTHNARLVCDDPGQELHGRPVTVEVSPDQTVARMVLTVGGYEYPYELPICVEEDVPEEIPCCIRDGRLYCPDHPDYHGMDYERYQAMARPTGPCFDVATGTFVGGPYDGKQAPEGTWKVSDDGDTVVVSIGGDVTSELPVCRAPRLERCPEIPPPPPPPPDCCVQETSAGLVLVCADENSPYHGYQLKEGEYQCHDTPQGRVCEVVLGVKPDAPCFDPQTGTFVGGPYDGKQAPQGTWSINEDGVSVTVSLGGDVASELPICPGGKWAFPLCPPPPPPPPPKCCFDVATGTLLCQADPDHEWNNLKVSLENLVTQGDGMFAVVSHAMLGSAPITVPVCEVEIPPECCFQAADYQAGSVGQLVCPDSPALDGTPATLTDVTQASDGTLLGMVGWAGGGGRMPFCRPPDRECPECPPPYFCCVNLDTGTYVCPANTEKHGTQADVLGVEEYGGMPFVRLSDKSLVPACGSQCPAPEPCPECPKCAPPGECPECPPPPKCPECPPQGECPKCEPECQQPPYGEFPGQPVGLVPKGTGPCNAQGPSEGPPVGEFPGHTTGFVPSAGRQPGGC